MPTASDKGDERQLAVSGKASITTPKRRLLVIERVAEISLHRPADEEPVLLVKRIIESVMLTSRRDLLRARGFRQHQRDGIPRRQPREQEDDDRHAEQHDDRLQDPTENVSRSCSPEHRARRRASASQVRGMKPIDPLSHAPDVFLAIENELGHVVVHRTAGSACRARRAWSHPARCAPADPFDHIRPRPRCRPGQRCHRRRARCSSGRG